jgi:hypothetical protein
MAELGLHVQFMMDANAIEDALPCFAYWRLPIVIDLMGNVDAARGANQPGVQLFCRLLAEVRIWVKLSGAHRISNAIRTIPMRALSMKRLSQPIRSGDLARTAALAAENRPDVAIRSTLQRLTRTQHCEENLVTIPRGFMV